MEASPSGVVLKKEMQGCLQRYQGGVFKQWKAFYYECKGGLLKEYAAMANPETSKPREVIDLSGSYVEDAADATGKQFAFILNTKNEAIQLMASSDVEKMKWMQTLGGRLSVKKFGLKTEKSDKTLVESKSDLSSSSNLDLPASQEHSAVLTSQVGIDPTKYSTLEIVRVCLMEGRGFKGKKRHNYYVNVFVDQVQKGRSSIQWGTQTPFWAENFLFEDVSTAKVLTLSVVNVGSRENKEDTAIVGEVDINIKSSPPNISWYTLKNKADKSDKGDIGALSIEITKFSMKILPLKEYASFLKSILADELTAPKILAKIIGSGAKVEEVARRLLNVFISNNKVSHLVCSLTADEINETDNPAIMFRGNSLATKVVDLYMKEFGGEYLKVNMKSCIQEIYEDKQSCEVDPTRLEKITELVKNRERLVYHVKNCWNSILKTSSSLPYELRIVFRGIREAIVKKFPGDEYANLKYTAVVGFAFLRYFCPAILNPYLFSVMPDHPDESSKRTLTLVAKTLQNLANLVEFGEKESYMTFLNTFIIDNKTSLKNFVDVISDPQNTQSTAPQQQKSLTKDLAFLYRSFIDYKEKLREHDSDPKVKDMFRVLMKLEFTYSSYETR